MEIKRELFEMYEVEPINRLADELLVDYKRIKQAQELINKVRERRERCDTQQQNTSTQTPEKSTEAKK